MISEDEQGAAVAELAAFFDADQNDGPVCLSPAVVRSVCLAAIPVGMDAREFRAGHLWRRVRTAYAACGYPLTMTGAYAIEGLLVAVGRLLYGERPMRAGVEAGQYTDAGRRGPREGNESCINAPIVGGMTRRT